MYSVIPSPRADFLYQLDVGHSRFSSLSVVRAPQNSVLALARQIRSTRTSGVAPSDVRERVRAGLRRQSWFALTSVADPNQRFFPNCFAPLPPTSDTTVDQQVATLRDLPGNLLVSELDTMFGDALPDAWRPAARDPRRWLHSWARASLDIWTAAEHHWRAAGPTFDRELRRIGTAAVRGAVDVLLNSLHPRLSFRDDVLAFDCARPLRVPLGGRKLVLLPMIAGPDALSVGFELADVAYIGYPLPPSRSGSGADGDVDALRALVGPVRAAALRALSQPLSVGQLAKAAQCAPTTLTYHCDRLHAAGLVTRERAGATVYVHRTERASNLIELFGG